MVDRYALLVSFSDLADEGVVLPLSLLLTVFFCLMGWKRGVLGWLIACGGTLTVVVLSKFLLYMVNAFVHLPVGLVSPSAHAAVGSLVWGSLAALVVRGGRAGIRTALVTSGYFAIMFSLTRLELGVHTRSEVILGSIFGLIGTVAFVKLAGKTKRAFYRVRLIALTAIVVWCTWGYRTHGEYFIKSAAHITQMAIRHAFAAHY